MATPQPVDPQGGQSGYDQQQYEQYDPNQQDGAEVPGPGTTPAPSAAAKKKRHYAGQAYEFGVGGNAALGGQQVGGGQYPPPPAPNYGGYGGQSQQAGHTAPGYGSGPASPAVVGSQGYGQQAQAVGGYQSPEPAYPAQGVPPPQQPGVGGITQGMGAMTVGNQTQHQSQMQGQMHSRPPMNQLYPTDILNSPLNVAELDLPPPPIILPPNVSIFQQ